MPYKSEKKAVAQIPSLPKTLPCVSHSYRGNISNQDDSDDVLEFDYDGLAAGAGLGLAFAFGGDLGGVVQIGLDYLYRNVTTTIVDTDLMFDLVAHRITIGIDVGLYF